MRPCSCLRNLAPTLLSLYALLPPRAVLEGGALTAALSTLSVSSNKVLHQHQSDYQQGAVAELHTKELEWLVLLYANHGSCFKVVVGTQRRNCIAAVKLTALLLLFRLTRSAVSANSI